MKKAIITAVALLTMGFTSAMALEIKVYNAVNQSGEISSWISDRGGYVTVLEDFEKQTKGWYTKLDTSVGTFAAAGAAGTGATSCSAAGANCPGSDTDDSYFSIQDRSSDWYGRYNTTEDGSKWLDSGDITELNLAVNETLGLTNLFFYIQDPSDVNAKTTIGGVTSTASFTFNDKFLNENNADSFFFGITLAENETLKSLNWHVSTAGDGYGLDDFSTAGPAPVPEPATMLLFGTGLVGLAGIARRRKKTH